MQTDHKAPFLNPIPWVIWLLALPMIAMEVVVSAGASGLVGGPAAIGWRLEAVNRFAFSPELVRWMVENRQFPLEGVARFVTYPFVHGSVTHTVFAVVFLLALGKMVAEVFRPWAVLAVFFGSAIGGVLLHTLVGLDDPVFGAYPPDYGLIGAFTFLLWVRLTAVGANATRAFTLIGMLLGVQLLFGLLFGGGWYWVSDLGGFATGFLLSFVLVPGGWARVRDRIRAR